MNEFLIKQIFNEILGVNVNIDYTNDVENKELITEENKYNSIITNEFLNHNYTRAVFSNIVNYWKTIYTNQENINEVFGIDLMSYNEDIYALFRSLIFPLFGNNEAIINLISWYIIDREYIDDDGKINHYPMKDNDDKEIDVSTPLKFYDYLLYLSTHEKINLVPYNINENDEDDFDEDDFDEDDFDDED